ncbi:AAA family ATPase [Granulosicoccus sp. 3-233]|uniref:AAA family ATPase n=1 Tax=Granulosicoccus sp. 3-233 TaxID=3417969 RepID=UPI003D32B1AA
MSTVFSDTLLRQGRIELNTAYFAICTSVLTSCLWSPSARAADTVRQSLSGLPVDRFSPILVTVLAITLLLIVVVHHRRTRKPSSPPARVFRFAEKMADIAYAPQLRLVGPARPEDTPNAFTDSIQPLSQLCEQTLTASHGRSVALVGTRPGSGTTTIAIALARRLAHSGKRTLLLDLNFERPMVQLSTGATSAAGISNYLLSGLIDGIVAQDAASPLDIIGTGNLPLPAVKAYLDDAQYKDSMSTLMSMYERVIIDCAPASVDQPDVSRIVAGCDLRLLVIDSQHDTVQSPNVQGLLRIHRRWHHGNTLLLRNKVKTDPEATESAGADLSPQSSLRPVHSEKWILQQPDELYTLKLTELRYRPVLTRRQISNYAGHQVACFRLTVLDEVNYLLILGQFQDRDAAMQAARTLGLTQPSVLPITFADVKKGIRLELQRKLKAVDSTPA